MAVISITIPDAQLQRVVNALCAHPIVLAYPQAPTVPATGAAAKQIVVDWVKANIVAYEMELERVAIIAPDTTGLVT